MPRKNENIFLKYSISSKAYKVFNKNSLIVEKFIHIIFYKTNDKSLRKKDILDDNIENVNREMKDLTLKDTFNQNEEEDPKKVDVKKKYKNQLKA